MGLQTSADQIDARYAALSSVGDQMAVQVKRPAAHSPVIDIETALSRTQSFSI
jgi:hypothetical protein